MKPPPEQRATVRERLCRELRGESLDARELSGLVGISEKEVVRHLEHLRRSLRHRGGRLRVTPALCRTCGFTFDKRERLSRPTGCPRCRGERIGPPRFSVE